MPPTKAVNPQTQCTRDGCGTMLLPDGTCPRCDPPSRRTTGEKLRLAEQFKDPKLQRLAQSEIDNDRATGLDHEGRARPPSRALTLSDDVAEDLHDRIDALTRQMTDGFRNVEGEIAKLKLAAPALDPVDPSKSDLPPTG